MPTLPSVNSNGRHRVQSANTAIHGRPVGVTLRSWLAQQIPASPREKHLAGSLTRRDWSHNTAFFRDDALWHDFCADAMLFSAARAGTATGELRVWSCGCSSGEELFSAKMVYERWVAPTFVDALGKAPRFVGLGTDRSLAIVQTASKASKSRFSAQALSNVPPEFMTARPAQFVEQPESASDQAARLAREYASGDKEPPVHRYMLSEHARADCTFAVEDLSAEVAGMDTSRLEPSSSPQLYDVIMCRYSIFLYSDDEAAAKRALHRIVSRLAPRGILLLGLTDPLPRCAMSVLELVPPADGDAAPESWLGASPSMRARQQVNAWRLKAKARVELAPSCGHGLVDISDSGGSSNARALLESASGLQQWRRLLGLKPRFAEEAPRPNTPQFMSEASLSILKASGLAELTPLRNRAIECAAEHSHFVCCI